MNKTNLKIDKPIYVGLSIRELGKAVMYEFWYDNIKLSIRKKGIYVTWIQIAFL